MFTVILLGKFQIVHKNGVLDEEMFHSDKLIKLLIYILINRHQVCTLQNAAELLWQDEETDNPAGALKNLVYRLRLLLRNKLENEEYILSVRGGYLWNPKIEIELDIEQFEKLCLKAKESSKTRCFIMQK